MSDGARGLRIAIMLTNSSERSLYGDESISGIKRQSLRWLKDSTTVELAFKARNDHMNMCGGLLIGVNATF